jgi:hypothetical protein
VDNLWIADIGALVRDKSTASAVVLTNATDKAISSAYAHVYSCVGNQDTCADYVWTYSACMLIYEQHADDEYARFYRMGRQGWAYLGRVFADVSDMAAPVVSLLSPSVSPLNATTILIALSVDKPDTVILGMNGRDARCDMFVTFIQPRPVARPVPCCIVAFVQILRPVHDQPTYGTNGEDL